VKGGYCALCKIKHDDAKKHADSSGHRQVIQRLMTKKSELVQASHPCLQVEDTGNI